MALDLKTTVANRKRISLVGTLMLAAGIVLSILPMLIEGRGAVVIYYLIIFGPFVLLVGVVIHLWLLVSALKTRRRH
jgi:hypothetical protein